MLPFRVWQIFEMVGFPSDADFHEKFVCAAGVLTHNVGDACQPLRISYIHDGDPLQATIHTVRHVRGKKAGTTEDVKKALGEVVHSAYEDDMVNNMRKGDSRRSHEDSKGQGERAHLELIRGRSAHREVDDCRKSRMHSANSIG